MVSSAFDIGKYAPVPWTHRDEPRVALLDFRVGHIRAEMRAVGFHYVDLVAQALRIFVLDTLGCISGGQAKKD